MNQLEILIALLVVVVVLLTIARRVLIPYPILLVLGGLALSFVPNLPSVHLHPDLIFLVFLPPILWSAAYLTSLRDFRAELRLIVLLAVGLVVATTVAVAAVARLLLSGMPWAAAFALGAIVSPPDAAAATAIGRQLRIPHRILTVLEGESLINDASALVLYRAAVTAAVTGSFVLPETLLEFVLVTTGGVVVGLIVGGATRLALRVTGDSLAHTAITLVAPYAAWILAERVHVSDDTLARQEAHARQEAARAALARLERLAGDTGPYPHLIERLRSAYDQRLRRASPLAAADDDVSARTQAAYRRLVHEALEAERRALVAPGCHQ